MVLISFFHNQTGERELEDFFSKVGKVEEARIAKDRDTGRSRGFGFVTMSSSSEAQAAVKELDGSELDGRDIKVQPTMARGSKPSSEGCRAFARGNCTRGDSCRFSHTEGGGGDRGGRSDDRGGYGGSRGRDSDRGRDDYGDRGGRGGRSDAPRDRDRDSDRHGRDPRRSGRDDDRDANRGRW